MKIYLVVAVTLITIAVSIKLLPEGGIRQAAIAAKLVDTPNQYKEVEDAPPAALDNLSLTRGQQAYNEASSRLSEALSTDNTAQRENLLKRAIDQFSLVLTEYPDDTNSYLNRATAYAELGQLETALADLNAALQINPNMVEAYQNRATYFEKQGDLQAALTDYEQVLKLLTRQLEIQTRADWYARTTQKIEALRAKL